VYSITNLARGLPGPLLHVAGRLMYYGKDRGTMAVVSIGSGLEILLTALAGLVVSLLTLSSERVGGVISPVWIIVVLIIGLGALHPRLAGALVRRASGAGDEDSEIRLSYWQTLRWLIWYGADWILGGLMFFALIGALIPISIQQLPYVIGAWSLAGLVSVLTSFLPFSLGIRELALSLLLMEILPSSVAVVFAIMSRILLTVYVAVWASIAYAMPSRSRFSGKYSQRSIDA
jgi:glycosyltransferase 2 family protein